MGSEKTENTVYRGIAASGGIVIGRTWVADRSRVAVVECSVDPDEVPGELDRFRQAVARSRQELQEVRERLATERGEEHLYVLDSHLMMLDDGLLSRQTLEIISQERINAEAALKRSLQRFRELFASFGDEYLRERSSDIEIVVERILRNMVGKEQHSINDVDGRVIVVAHDLAPSDILQIDKERVIGFVTDLGGKTSHSAILARALEIPAVVGMERITQDLGDDVPVILDGFTGTLIAWPDQDTFREYLKQKQVHEYLERELHKLRDLPAETLDGHRISLQGNVEFLEEIPSVRGHGAEGVGLYRTEMIFFNRAVPPDEEEQFSTYAEVVRRMAPLPVTIRTLDVGGDKFVPDLNLSDEMNPALGLRAIRLSLREPSFFKVQLRAILRASALGPASIFFPMISGVDEIRRSKALLEEAKAELRQAGIPFDEQIRIGIMIEVPSAVLVADLLAREVDFFSVGTNDLIQYTMAIDRTNEHLSHLYEPLHPAVIRSLKIIVDAAHAAGIQACMCGEMASEASFLPILLGLGFDQLSMNGPAIPRVKKILRRCRRRDAEEIVDRALSFATAQEVDSYLKGEIAGRYSDSID
jgi:phosphotransferase system enzyme I (PtsI)